MTDLIETFLKHHGIKGQRWGVTRNLQEKRREQQRKIADDYVKGQIARSKTSSKKKSTTSSTKTTPKPGGGSGGGSSGGPEEDAKEEGKLSEKDAARLKELLAKEDLTDEEKAELKELQEKKGGDSEKGQNGSGGGKGGAGGAGLKKDKKAEAEKKAKKEDETRQAIIADRKKAADAADFLSRSMLAGIAGNNTPSNEALAKEVEALKTMMGQTGHDANVTAKLQSLAARSLAESKGGTRRSPEQRKEDAEYIATMVKRFRDEAAYIEEERKRDAQHGDSIDTYMKHFGVKGMKWGVRKDRSSSSSPKAEKLSDAELKKRVNRLNMEKQYKSLTEGKADEERTSVERGRDYVNDLMAKQADAAVNRAAQNVTNYIVDNPDKTAAVVKKYGKKIIEKVKR